MRRPDLLRTLRRVWTPFVKLWASFAIVWAALAITETPAAHATPAPQGPVVADNSPRDALEAGNQLFHTGQLEAAINAYLEGYSPEDPDPTLLYNLGTTLHHLGRLPEAILWYRRAAAAGPTLSRSPIESSQLDTDHDPWLQENLWLARRSLGTRTLPAQGVLGGLARHSDLLRTVAIALAWLVPLWFVVRRPASPWPLAVVALLAFSLYACAAAVERWGPRPVVILKDCATPSGLLSAGTEAWAQPSTDGGRLADGAGSRCPSDALGWVAPDSGGSGSQEKDWLS